MKNILKVAWYPKLLLFILTISLMGTVIPPYAVYAVTDKNSSLGNESSVKDSAKIITTEDALLSSVTTMLNDTKEPSAEKPKLPKASNTSDFTWSSPQILHGIFSSAELYFTLPAYWDTQYAYIQIEYKASQLIKDVPASLTFTINKQPFYSCSIVYSNSETKTFSVLIPKELLKNDPDNRSNHLEVSGYARLYNTEGCMDNDSDASWITISEASGVQIGYEAREHNNRIDYYPYPFMSSLDKDGSDTAIAVADVGQNQEVAAAMTIMSNLSGQIVKENQITLGTWNDIKSGKAKNRIFIGLTKDTPAELQKYINQYQNQLTDQALILFVNDDKNQPLLIIVSEDADCLMEAASLLGDSERVSQEKGNYTLIKKGSADIKVNAVKSSEMKADRYTLQGITGGGLSFVGPFHQTKTLTLPVPSDYTLSTAGKISITFRYSKNLDFNRSMLSVFWGDIPIGSKKLTLEKADEDELTFFIPSDVVGTNTNKVIFTFDLEIPDMVCTSRQDEMPWAYITQNSSLYLPAENDVKLKFDNKPAPFIKNGSFNDILLVTSDYPTSSELTLLGRAVALYGKGADSYGKLKVLKASEFSEKDTNYNIITSGTPFNNSLIAKVNDKLYFKYDEYKTKFLTNDKLILSSEYAKTIGTLQLLQSPYASNRALLVLTGPTEETLKMVNKIVSNEKLSWNLKNDCVVIDSEGKTKSYLFQKNVINDQKPSLVQTLVANKNSLLFTLAGISVMLVLFLAMLLILLRMNIAKRKNKEP